MESFVIPLRPILIFAVVLARVGGVVTFAPFWNHKAVNGKIRALLAMVISLLLTPVLMPHIATPPTEIFHLTLLLGGELIIGFILGFAGRLVFSALEIAASMVGFQMGLSLASTIDPATQAQTAALGIMAQMLGLMVMLAADGHHWMLEITVRSFQLVAPGGFGMSGSLAELMLRLSADALAVGVALATPGILILLSVESLLAVAGRVAPKLEILILGFPVKIAAGLWLLGTSIFFLPSGIRTAFTTLRHAVERMLEAM
ncbi:MAG TPA: flagellar biosynthetic protein FliR [Blastocatellia bacterium]|nr:flagellar biosynthetic protein FliR [Blastocatellia bacterium]